MLTSNMDPASAIPNDVCAAPTKEPSVPTEPKEPAVREPAETTRHLVKPAKTQEPNACQLVASRPSVDLGCSAKQWDTFLNQWARFAILSDLDDERLAPQCRACLTDQLKEAVMHARGDVNKLEVKDLLCTVQSVAVEPPIGRRRYIAHNSKQAAGESFADFAAQVAKLVSVCEYAHPCPHAPKPPEPPEG